MIRQILLNRLSGAILDTMGNTEIDVLVLQELILWRRSEGRCAHEHSLPQGRSVTGRVLG